MMYRILIGLLALGAVAFAQTAAITFPTASFAFPDGTVSTALTSTCTSCPSAASAEYFVDEESQGIVWSAPYSLSWNSYYVFNGAAHQVYVIYRNSLPAPNNIVATSPKITFSTANTWPFDAVSPTTLSCTFSTSTPVTSPWAASQTITGAVTGSTVTAGHASTNFYVDSWSVGSQNGGSPSRAFDTRRFTNGKHLVTVVTRDSSLGSSPQGCQWGPYSVDFENTNSAMDLLVNPAEFYLAPASTQQLTPTILNADLSTTGTVGTMTYTSSDTTICTVTSPGGLVTYVNSGGQTAGLCQITATSSLITSPVSPTIVYGYAMTANTLPHFGKDGQIRTSYDASATGSAWEAGLFSCDAGWLDYLSSTGAYGGNLFSVAQWFAAFLANGFNTCDTGHTGAPSAGNTPTSLPNVSQATFIGTSTTGLTGAFNDVLGWFNPNGEPIWPIRPHVIINGMLSDDNAIYPWFFGTPATFTPLSGAALLFQQFSGVGAQYSSVDEVTNNLGGNPNPISTIKDPLTCSTAYGVDCLVSVVCDGAGNGKVNWNSPYPGNGSSTFAIYGATGHPSLNITVGTSLYKISSSDANSFSWIDANSKFGATTACSTAFTATSATDPGLHVEAFINAWQTNANKGTGYPGSGPGYLPSTWMSLVRAAQNAAVPRPPLTNPAQAGGSPEQIFNWMSRSTAADYAELYFNDSNNLSFYTPTHGAISYVLNDNGVTARRKWSNLRANIPFLSSTSGSPISYGVTGLNIPIASISGKTVTFSQPHGIYNVIPGTSRGTISGATGTNATYYNNDFFIESCPTATTCTITPRKPLGQGGVSLTCSGANCGTVTFQDGSPFALTQITSCATCGGGSSQPILGITASAAVKLQKVGQTFTISGMTGGTSAANAYYNANTFYNRDDGCTNPAQGCYGKLTWAEVPPAPQSATGGTFAVVADNLAQWGRNQIHTFKPNPDFPFLSDIVTATSGGAGYRQYGLTTYGGFNPLPDTFPTWPALLVTDTPGSVQARLSPFYDITPFTKQNWYGSGTANLLISRMVPYLFQPRCASPDLGFMFDSTCRTGSLGKLQIAVNFSDSAQTRNVDISACVVGGQPTLKYLATWSGITITSITAGTTTDSNAVFPPASAAFYMCSNNAAAEYSKPIVSVRLADIPSATKVVVRYAYQQYLLAQATSNAVDCGTGAACSIPVDLKIGPVSCQVLYLNSSGAILHRYEIAIPQLR